MLQVTKNIFQGEPITDLRDLVRLAEERKSVVVKMGYGYLVQPAGWLVQMSLANLARFKIFYSIKILK